MRKDECVAGGRRDPLSPPRSPPRVTDDADYEDVVMTPNVGPPGLPPLSSLRGGRSIWTFGALHALVGSAILFLTIHPLRAALEPRDLEVVIVGSALQAVQGVALMVLSLRAGGGWGALLIALGTALWTGMLYFIAFTSMHPLDPVVPAGGMLMLVGWIMIVLAGPRATTA